MMLIAAGLVVVVAVALLLIVASVLFGQWALRERTIAGRVWRTLAAIVFALSALAWLLLGVGMVAQR